MGKIVSEAHKSAESALFGYQAHFNAQVVPGTLIGMAKCQIEWQGL